MNKIIKTNEKGSIIVISGPSGSGKGTVIHKLMDIYPNIWYSVSATSRAIRANDIPGETYYFITKEEFEEKIKNNEFLEYTCYNGNYYGTYKKHIEDKINSGLDVILELDVPGALNIKRMIPSSICIFIMPPSMEELKSRLVNRKTDSKDAIIERFKTSYQEINMVNDYNYVVVNDEIDTAAKKIKSILISEKCRVDRIEEIYLGNKEELIHELLMDNKDFINEEISI